MTAKDSQVIKEHCYTVFDIIYNIDGVYLWWGGYNGMRGGYTGMRGG